MSAKLGDSERLEQISELTQKFQDELVDGLGPITRTTRNILLRLFEIWQQICLRRILDLASEACEMFSQQRLVPGCTLTRSIYETVGIQYYVHKKIVEYIEKADPKSIHDLLLACVFGGREKSSPETAIQVLTAIDHLDKEFNGSRDEYNHLCEYAHPNLKGGFGTYAFQKNPDLEMDFGVNPNRLEMAAFGLTGLHMIMIIGTEVQRRFRLLQPSFINMVNTYSPNKFI